MALKTLQAVLPDLKTTEDVLPCALHVAESFNAHLTGYHVMQAVTYFIGSDYQLPENIYHAQRTAVQDEARQVEERFIEGAKSAGINFDWQCDGALHQDYLHALYNGSRSTDLLFVSQATPSGLDLNWDLATSLAMECGRPVVMVPPETAKHQIGRRILVAWNGSKEAARATFDAMEFLTRADDVVIVAVDEPANRMRQSFSSADSIATALSRHDIKTEVRNLERDGFDPAGLLLEQSKAHNSDLLVMGCYGHSRLNEFVFGGTTRSVLRESKIPILLAN